MALILSQYKIGAWGILMPSSWRKDCTHVNSIAKVTTTSYSASVEDCATIHYFLELYEIGVLLR